MRSRRLPVVVGIVALAGFFAAGCGSSASTAGSGANAKTLAVPLPAGKSPSLIAEMVCRPKAQSEIAAALGVASARVSPPTWVDHLYSCGYEYADGVMTLSVKELSSWAQTLAYFRGLERQFGKVRSLANLGQGAFIENDGSVVVRKDWKVLIVDITGLPDQFGVPPTSSGEVAVTVADVILGCWDGD
jgi:hypothetical protein